MMEDKTKLYVFSRKEVALIFIFIMLLASTSFVLGIKIGKNYSYQAEGLTLDDKAKVDFLSGQEEQVNEVVKEREQAKETTGDLAKETHDSLKKKIMDELSKDETTPVLEKKEIKEKAVIEKAPVNVEMEQAKTKDESQRDELSGKYTIQIGSHRSYKEAEEFAEGFRVRGYNPIINEVEIKTRGTWYRVSIGVFDNISQAKEYTIKEKSLFQGQNYVYIQFD